MDAEHTLLAKKFEEEVNNHVSVVWRGNQQRKDPICLLMKSLSFFSTKDYFKKDDVQQKQFFQDLGLLVVKNHLFMHFVESS